MQKQWISPHLQLLRHLNSSLAEEEADEVDDHTQPRKTSSVLL